MLAVLPTGYGNHQLLPPVLNFSDFMNHEGRSSAKKSTVLVISPLNALIRDLIVKIREEKLNVPVEMLLNTTYYLIFAHDSPRLLHNTFKNNFVTLNLVKINLTFPEKIQNTFTNKRRDRKLRTLYSCTLSALNKNLLALFSIAF